MAAGQDFLSLVNSVLRRFNEVELTSVNFNSARGFHAQVRDAVNSAIQDICAIGVEWPFNNLTTNAVLTPGSPIISTFLYSLGAKPDLNSFMLLRDDSVGIGASQFIPPISYDASLQENDYDRYGDVSGPPRSVALTRAGREIRVHPVPDKAYTVSYEYYLFPATELVAPADETRVPNAYRYVIVDGASAHCHLFRTDMEAWAATKKRFDDGILHMRKNLINQTEYARSYLSLA